MIKLVRFAFIAITLCSIEADQSKLAQAQSPISIDLQEVEVSKALQILAKFAGLNLVVENTIQGKVSLHLTQASAEEALQAILQLQDLTQRRRGNTRIIRRKQGVTTDTTETPIGLTTKQVMVKHRAAKDVAHLFLEEQSNKTSGSDLRVDTQSNSLWVRDTQDRIQTLENLVAAIDQTVQQVLIEARVVSANRNFDRSLGVRFIVKPPVVQDNASTDESNENQSQKKETHDNVLPLNIDFSSFQKSVNTLWPSLKYGLNRLLDLELAAMESEGTGRVIASPHLITTNKTPALIEAGSEIPYQEKSRYGTSIAFKKAALSLQVTPEIKPSGQMLLKLEVHHDKPGTPSLENTAAIDTQRLKTQVLISSGETVALGGIYETVEQKIHYRLPGIGKIPILGRFFSQKGNSSTTRELLVFVTPYIVSEELLKQRREVHVLG